MAISEISKITLPSGTTYNLKDATARSEIEQIAGGGLVATVVTTLPEASASTLGRLYLVPSGNGSDDNYNEYLTVTSDDGETYSWERIGNTDIDLTNYVQYGDQVIIDTTSTAKSATGITIADHTVTQGTTNTTAYISKDEVLGSDTTFTNAASSVTFTGGTTDSVLGADTTATVPKVSATTAKLATTSIVPTDGTVSIPNVTGNVSVSIPNVTENADVTATKISSYGTLPTLTTTVQNETLTIGWDAGALTAGADVSASKVTLGTELTATNTTLGTALSAAKVGSAVTVATGATSASDASGATIMTGLGTNGTESVTFGTNDRVTAVTNIGTGTAGAQTITVGTNDKVNAVVGVSGTTSAGAVSATLNGTTSGVEISSHNITDGGHAHSVSVSGEIGKSGGSL